MSASREKKKRQELTPGSTADPKAAREAEARADARKTNILYGTLGVLFVALAVFLVVYNSGILERNKTAVTIGGESYSVAQASYYYHSAYQNFINSQNGYYAMAFGMLDTNTPLKDQSYDDTQTWDDYFKSVAVENMQFVHAAKKAAQEAGVTLGEEEMEAFNNTVDSLKESAKSNGYGYKAYVGAVYGSTVTPSIYEDCLKDYLLANKFATDYYAELSYTDDEIGTYYSENKNSYDLVDGILVTLSGTPEAKTDADGNAVAATDEEKAEAMKQAKETAEEILAAYKDGKDIEAMATEAEAGYSESAEMTYTDSLYGNWFFDESRKTGDAEVLENESGSSYYVVIFNGRERDEALEYNVRHVLVSAESLELARRPPRSSSPLRPRRSWTPGTAPRRASPSWRRRTPRTPAAWTTAGSMRTCPRAAWSPPSRTGAMRTAARAATPASSTTPAPARISCTLLATAIPPIGTTPARAP